MLAKIAAALKNQAQEMRFPDGKSFFSLTVAQTELLASQYGVSTKTIEIVALENTVIPLRYARNQKALTARQQIQLLKSRAAVVGLGGLGGHVVEILARAGVGALSLIDGDTFEDHNLNRQLLSTHGLLGTSKAKAARDRVRSINPSVEVDVYDLALTPENASRLITACQVVMDCLDTITARFNLETAAKNAGIPMISAAVAGAGGHVTTIFPEDPGLHLIYGRPEALKSAKGIEDILGCLPQAVALVASVESAEALKLLSGNNKGLLRNKLLVVDLSDNQFDVLRLT